MEQMSNRCTVIQAGISNGADHLPGMRLASLNRYMKIAKIPLICALLVSSTPGFARQGGSEGGGDPCENQFMGVRDEIQDWIKRGGANELKLADVPVNQYSYKMLTAIRTAAVKCVSPGDVGFPVQIEGTPKVCKFQKGSSSSQITCDFGKLMSLRLPDLYSLVHHEYAGLAGLELPHGDDKSNYYFSNQITGFLSDDPGKGLLAKRPYSKFKANCELTYLPKSSSERPIWVNIENSSSSSDRRPEKLAIQPLPDGTAVEYTLVEQSNPWPDQVAPTFQIQRTVYSVRASSSMKIVSQGQLPLSYADSRLSIHCSSNTVEELIARVHPKSKEYEALNGAQARPGAGERASDKLSKPMTPEVAPLETDADTLSNAESIKD